MIKYYVGTGQAFMGPVPTEVIHIVRMKCTFYDVKKIRPTVYFSKTFVAA